MSRTAAIATSEMAILRRFVDPEEMVLSGEMVSGGRTEALRRALGLMDDDDCFGNHYTPGITTSTEDSARRHSTAVAKSPDLLALRA